MSIESKILMDFICNDTNQVAPLQTKDTFYWLLNNEHINIITKLSEFILKEKRKKDLPLTRTHDNVLILNSCVQAYIYIYYILNILIRPVHR